MQTISGQDGSKVSTGKIKPGRTDGKNSFYRSGATRVGHHVQNEIKVILAANVDKAIYRDKKVGFGTQEKRRDVINGFFSDLFYLRFKVESVHNLKQKHLTAVFNFLEEQGQSASTLQQKISTMRTFCEWIGKTGMVVASHEYVKDPRSIRRTMVVQEDKSWVGNGIELAEMLKKISEKDKYVGIWLELCWAFGLRLQEAVMLRPSMSQESGFLLLREGTKGDRSRIIPMEEQVQADVMERAELLADKKTGMLGVRGKSVKQKKQRVYTVMRGFGLTLSEKGVSAHGLRHQYMHTAFERLTGEKPPVKGGDLMNIDPEQLHVASQKLMERAGHTRVTIGASYYGSRRRRHSKTVIAVAPTQPIEVAV